MILTSPLRGNKARKIPDEFKVCPICGKELSLIYSGEFNNYICDDKCRFNLIYYSPEVFKVVKLSEETYKYMKNNEYRRSLSNKDKMIYDYNNRT
jgi:endo-1,4-beta-D-glucanase Y